MIDLTTSYLGLTLKNPLVASPSPFSEDVGKIRQMEDAGAGAVVLHSLFEEQINLESHELDRALSYAEERSAEAFSYFPNLAGVKLGPDEYLEHIRKARAAVQIPVIASLNGVSTGGWIRYARQMEEAGASALELNIYFVSSNPDLAGSEVEKQYVGLVRDVKANLGIPVAVKVGPYFSSMANLAKQLDEAGADGLVLFNRFYQPDFDLEALEVVPNLVLSTPYELLLRLHWVAILYGRIKADMAITGGVHSGQDGLKAMMAGAKVAMMTSALLKHGIPYLGLVRDEMVKWMDEHEYESIRQMQGSMSQRSVAEPAAFLRANYMKVLSSYSSGSFLR
ncbi:MAG: dihydroorotate dehydrogenase-like protein [Bryobacterales bacterium]|nr:dihydroorotate dehydrogenase-like protein [Bryobacterales bacterium]